MVNEASYATRTLPKENKLKSVLNFTTVGHFTLHDIQKELNFQFTAMLIDCEGCINSLFGTNIDTATLGKLLHNVRTIILEGDMSDRDGLCTSFCVNYGQWIEKFKALGFTVVEEEQDKKFPAIVHYVLQRNSSL